MVRAGAVAVEHRGTFKMFYWDADFSEFILPTVFEEIPELTTLKFIRARLLLVFLEITDGHNVFHQNPLFRSVMGNWGAKWRRRGDGLQYTHRPQCA